MNALFGQKQPKSELLCFALSQNLTCLTKTSIVYSFSKLPDAAEHGVDSVGVGGVGGERVADLMAQRGTVFLERLEERR